MRLLSAGAESEAKLPWEDAPSATTAAIGGIPRQLCACSCSARWPKQALSQKRQASLAAVVAVECCFRSCRMRLELEKNGFLQTRQGNCFTMEG